MRAPLIMMFAVLMLPLGTLAEPVAAGVSAPGCEHVRAGPVAECRFRLASDTVHYRGSSSGNPVETVIVQLWDGNEPLSQCQAVAVAIDLDADASCGRSYPTDLPIRTILTCRSIGSPLEGAECSSFPFDDA